MGNSYKINVSIFYRPIICVLMILFSLSHSLVAQTLPTAFSKVKVATLDQGTCMAFAPDGRIFVCVKTGTVRIIKNGTLLSTPFVTLNVDINGERGVNSITFDPNFNTNHYVYIYYTAATPTVHNRLSRFTANGDVVVPGSEVPLLDLETVTQVYHNGGAMDFGPDGKLYLAVGEDNNPNNSQNLNVHKGKLLRLNADGSTPSDNPYFSSSSAVTRRIWAMGLRNPYTLSFQPGTGKLFINDVGADSYEDIHDATLPGKNFGWPAVEGSSSNPAYANPVFSYPHESTGQRGCAVVGGTFFNPTTTNYPSSYIGKYFYMDFCNGWMYYLTLGSSVQNTFFGSGLVTQNLSLKVGPDGNLYFINRSQPGIYKIIYANNNAPAISSHPSNVTVTAGQPASFSVSATGSNPLSFQWQRNGVNIPGATSSTYSIGSTQTSQAGQYRAVVTNNYGTATSNAATLTVTSFNAAPVATISTPSTGAQFRAGDVINFTGDATDAEDGILPASAFEWIVEFHHNNNHFHPGPVLPLGVKTGSFTTSNNDHTSANIFYRLKLKVTDSHGLIDTAFVDISPITSTITINSQPAGLDILFDSQPKPTPFTTLTVEGLYISMGVVSPQTVNGQSYVFSHWQHGGNATQTIHIGPGDSSYTAVFKDTVIQNNSELVATGSNWKYLANGSNQGTAWRAASFNDAAWSSGGAQLGYGDGDESTVVSYGASSGNKYITTYFRKSFMIGDVSAIEALELRLMRDDGAVVYLNGEEVYRNNMPSGTINYNTLASTYIDGANESAYLVAGISKSALTNGINVIAVEVHQNSASSSDISFDLGLKIVSQQSNTEFIPADAAWKYLANGSNQGSAWRATTFNDATWGSGNAQFGYGDGDEATVVSYGTSSGNKFITTYFRKAFDVTNVASVGDLELSLLRDDGAVVYLNGTEVYRNNMPSGTISYNTLASTYIDGADESAFINTSISKSALINGTNVIAVEIHQNSPSSSDISFNLKLKTVSSSTGGGGTCSATGSITRDVWTNISGSTLSSVPFDSSPQNTGSLTIFEGPSNGADNYGSRIRGYVCPPVTGAYTFWIASDDNSELWLSTTDQPANKIKIASVTGWTMSREWAKYPSQKSAPIQLTAGTKYYIEALHKDGTQGDNLAVGWQLPDGTMERPIPGARLSPFTISGNDAPAVTITSPGNNTVFSSSANITITADAINSGGNISKVEFYQGNTKIGEDLTSPYAYTWMNVPTGNYALKALATNEAGLTGTSPVVNISVNTCSTPIITASGPTVVCSGSVVLNSSTGSNYAYQWKKNGANIANAISPSYTATSSGEYQVKVIHGSCISWSAPVVVRIENGLRASITPGGPTTFCQGSNVKLYGNTCSGYTYQWKKAGSDIGGANASTYTATASGNYQLKVTQNGANAWSALVSVSVQPCQGIDENTDEGTGGQLKEYTSTPTSSEPFQMKVYPNPTTGLFSIVLNMATTEQEKVKMKMVNMLGQEVYTKETVTNSSYLKETVELDGSLPPGIYTLQILVGNVVESTSVVLSKQ